MRLQKSTVRVGGQVFRIERSVVPDGNHNFAETSYLSRAIRIGKGCDSGHLPATLMHELLHAVSGDRALGLKEGQVESIANGLTAALIDLGILEDEMFLLEDND